jgi:uncharacterized protein
MIIDFHTHIFPEAIRKNRGNFFEGEPAFSLLYNSNKSKLMGADEIVPVMNEEGVDISVVFGFPWKNPDTARMHNDYIIHSVERYPEKLKGFCCVDPSWHGAADEVERCLTAGLSGVGELAFYTSGIDQNTIQNLEPLMDLCLKNKVPILIHTNEPIGHQYPGKTPITLFEIYNLAKHFPDNKIVLAHWGGGVFFYIHLKREVKDTLKNVYYDTAASPFLYDKEIYRTAVSIAGKNKVLFGSDYPLLKPSRYFQEIEESGLSKKDQARILGENAAMFFGINKG